MRVKSLILLVVGFSQIALSDPGTYVGNGKISMGGRPATPYKTTLKIDVVEKDVVKLTETYQMAGQTKPATFVTTLHFAPNGLLKVKKNGVEIGCGYWVDYGNGGRWADYRLQTEEGPLHVNAYFDRPTRTFHRIGDMIRLDGVGFWNDTLTLKKDTDEE